MKMRKIRKFIFFLGLGLNSYAHAAFDNYNSVLLGDRAAGLGAAFAALTGDASATPFYNPATTVLSPGSAIASSVTLYSKYDTQLGRTEDLVDATQRVNRGFFRSIPSASSAITHFGSFALGLNIVVPDYDTYSGPIRALTGANSFVSVMDESLWVGGTFSAKLDSRDALGLTLYYTARRFERSISDKVVTGSNVKIVLEEKSLTTNSLVAVMGFYRKISPTWAMGIAYRFPSLPISGEASYYRSTTDTTTTPVDVVTQNTGIHARTRVPAKFTLGFARENRGRNTISFDMNMYESVAYADIDFAAGADEISHRQVVNFSFGYEQSFGADIVWRMGLFTNFSSHPVPDPNANMRQADGVEMGGLASNVEFSTGENTWITIGGYYTGGRGKTVQYVGGSLALIEKMQQNYTLLISTGFRF